MNRYLSHYGIALALGAAACGASAAEAAPADAPPAAHAAGGAGPQAVRVELVGDDVLAHQTGKYAGSQMISGFVLNLLSQWQLPNGASALAQGSLTVAQNAANQLSASVQTSARVTDAGNTTAANSGANPNALASGGQAISVNGVSQITQVAGNGNVGSNAAQIDFNNNAAQLAQLANIAAGTAGSTANAANANGTVKAGIAFGNNGVTVSLQTPAGIATQTIVPSGAQQAGAIAQLLQVAGNNQQVANQLQLSLQTQQMSAAMIRQSGLLQALRNGH